MKEAEECKGKKVLVLGLAKSGLAAANLLHTLGADVTVNDASPEQGNEAIAGLKAAGIRVICGGHPLDLLDEGFQLIVKNPGIPYRIPFLQEAMKKGIPIWTELELAYRISEAPFIGITGSNGKTTTTTLLYHMLNIGNKNPLIAGNIGTVACSVAAEAQEDQIIVLEASSFQLMGIDTFKPSIAILTNLYEAHLDYHGSAEQYAQAKARITMNQTPDDTLIYNADQKAVLDVIKSTKATKVPFTLSGRTEFGISADDDAIYWNGEKFVDRTIIKLPGQHNLENILAATAAAILVGCTKESIENVLSSFTGVRHRTQFVRELKKRKFYNDSKATNTLATKSALASFEEPIILLAGGLDRGHSFEELRPYMKRVKAVVASGETAQKFAEFASSCGVETIILASDIQDAVQKSYPISEEGDVILLSPACASWDQYPDFEKRGDEFIQAVMSL